MIRFHFLVLHWATPYHDLADVQHLTNRQMVMRGVKVPGLRGCGLQKTRRQEWLQLPEFRGLLRSTSGNQHHSLHLPAVEKNLFFVPHCVMHGSPVQQLL
jgi:hypothetical protein